MRACSLLPYLTKDELINLGDKIGCENFNCNSTKDQIPCSECRRQLTVCDFTVAQLKNVCRKLGLTVSGTKDELIDKIDCYFQSYSRVGQGTVLFFFSSSLFFFSSFLLFFFFLSREPDSLFFPSLLSFT